MLRATLIGAGDISFHYNDLLNIPEEKLDEEIAKIAEVLAESGTEIILTPDRGICFEIAKEYKRCNGKKAYGIVPASDRDLGIKHLQPYLDSRVNGEKVIDNTLDTGNWYKQWFMHNLFGDIILLLGSSLGSHGELMCSYYFYKVFNGDKPEISARKKDIHQDIKAGEKMPLTLLIYRPFIKENLNPEIEAYIIKSGGKIIYVEDAEELRKMLMNLFKNLKTQNTAYTR